MPLHLSLRVIRVQCIAYLAPHKFPFQILDVGCWMSEAFLNEYLLPLFQKVYDKNLVLNNKSIQLLRFCDSQFHSH